MSSAWDLLAEHSLAPALAEEGQTQRSLVLYSKIVDGQNDSAPQVVLPYALMVLKSGNWDKALEEYKKALPHVGDGGLIGGHELLDEDGQEAAARSDFQDVAGKYGGEFKDAAIKALTPAGSTQPDRPRQD